MVGVFKKESCCFICEEVMEQSADLIKCRGTCQKSYCISCLKDKLGSDKPPPKKETWKCQECIEGKHKCLLCGSDEGEVERCNVNGCGKYMHRLCLKTSGLWPQARYANQLYTCPAHMCHTCASDNPKDPFMKYNTRLLKCIRCPTAYHSGDHCVAAGSVQITATQIVCPKHFKPPKSGKKGQTHHTNANWCFICSKGGSLICCETCPASFHPACLNIDAAPEGVYHCDHCETGRMPLYGEILWVKLGGYRWWPAQVVHPARIPDNIDRLQHDIGEFPVQFCGTKEYYWMTQGRCFHYESGDADRGLPGGGSGGSALQAQFARGVAEAQQLFEAYNEEKRRREEANAHKVKAQKHLKPAVFTRIMTNRAFGDCPVYTADPLDQQMCDCDPDKEDPCGEDSECLNRLLLCECRPSACRAGDKCGNQRFQRRKYPKLQVARTSSRGWGLTVHEEIKKGEFLIEYVGELITMAEFHRRMEQGRARKEEHNYYYMTVDNNRMIDAGPKGNIARFMNHSCDPNCETQKWTINGDTRVGLFALKDIPSGAELTFNYQFEAMGEVKQVCLCGAKNCSGFIGEKVTKAPRETKDKSKGDSSSRGGANGGNGGGNGGDNDSAAGTGDKKKKKIAKVSKTWEDLCYRCYEDGVLLMCDWKHCPKVYHLACLGREKMPREKWFCPWHHCVECGKTAVSHCIHCPNAYCKTHDSVLMQHKELGTICDEHQDDIQGLVNFYREVPGGVSTLVTNPNVPPVPAATAAAEAAAAAALAALAVEEQQLAEAAESAAEADNKQPGESGGVVAMEVDDDSRTALPVKTASPVKPTAHQPNSIEYKPEDTEEEEEEEELPEQPETPTKGFLCPQQGCETRAHKFRMEKHLVNTHSFTEEEAKKAVEKLVGENAASQQAGNLAEEETKPDSSGKPVAVCAATPKIPATGSLSGTPGHDFKCSQCKWTCSRRQRLTTHLQNIHEWSEEDAVKESDRLVAIVMKMRADRQAATRKIQQQQQQAVKQAAKQSAGGDENYPTHILTGEELETLLKCPVCQWAMRGSDLFRHISIKHPKFDASNVTPEKVLPTKYKENRPIINQMMKGDERFPGFLPRRRPVFAPNSVVSRKNIHPRHKPRLVRQEDKRDSPAHSLCTRCGCYIHVTNTARHWRMRHPEEKYSPSKMKPNRPQYVAKLREEKKRELLARKSLSPRKSVARNLNYGEDTDSQVEGDEEEDDDADYVPPEAEDQPPPAKKSKEESNIPVENSSKEENPVKNSVENPGESAASSLDDGGCSPDVQVKKEDEEMEGLYDDSEDEIKYCGYTECKFSCETNEELEEHRKEMYHPKLTKKRLIKPTSKGRFAFKTMMRLKQRAITNFVSVASSSSAKSANAAAAATVKKPAPSSNGSSSAKVATVVKPVPPPPPKAKTSSATSSLKTPASSKEEKRASSEKEIAAKTTATTATSTGGGMTLLGCHMCEYKSEYYSNMKRHKERHGRLTEKEKARGGFCRKDMIVTLNGTKSKKRFRFSAGKGTNKKRDQVASPDDATAAASKTTDASSKETLENGTPKEAPREAPREASSEEAPKEVVSSKETLKESSNKAQKVMPSGAASTIDEFKEEAMDVDDDIECLSSDDQAAAASPAPLKTNGSFLDEIKEEEPENDSNQQTAAKVPSKPPSKPTGAAKTTPTETAAAAAKTATEPPTATATGATPSAKEATAKVTATDRATLEAVEATSIAETTETAEPTSTEASSAVNAAAASTKASNVVESGDTGAAAAALAAPKKTLKATEESGTETAIATNNAEPRANAPTEPMETSESSREPTDETAANASTAEKTATAEENSKVAEETSSSPATDSSEARAATIEGTAEESEKAAADDASEEAPTAAVPANAKSTKDSGTQLAAAGAAASTKTAAEEATAAAAESTLETVVTTQEKVPTASAAK